MGTWLFTLPALALEVLLLAIGATLATAVVTARRAAHDRNRARRTLSLTAAVTVVLLVSTQVWLDQVWAAAQHQGPWGESSQQMVMWAVTHPFAFLCYLAVLALVGYQVTLALRSRGLASLEPVATTGNHLQWRSLPTAGRRLVAVSALLMVALQAAASFAPDGYDAACMYASGMVGAVFLVAVWRVVLRPRQEALAEAEAEAERDEPVVAAEAEPDTTEG